MSGTACAYSDGVIVKPAARIIAGTRSADIRFAAFRLDNLRAS